MSYWTTIIGDRNDGWSWQGCLAAAEPYQLGQDTAPFARTCRGTKVEPRFGSALMAYAWYRSEPLPGFDGWTAMQLVQDGKAQQVLEYIDAVDAGVFA